MPFSKPSPLHEDAERPFPQLGHAAVSQELNEILASTPFRTSRQCQALLRYVVEQTVNGQTESLRERVIGMMVFGRKPDYDPGEDPVVRIRAADVRKRLAQFYQGTERVERAVSIDIPAGSYRAAFRWPAPKTVELVERPPVQTAPAATRVEADPLPAPVTAPIKRRSWIAVWAALALAAIAALVWPLLLRQPAPPATSLDQFWAPFLGGQRPVLLCMGSNAVYRLSGRYMAHYRELHHLAATGAEQFATPGANETIGAGDLQAVPNTFTGIGDVNAESEIVQQLAHHDKAFQLRFAGDVSFPDLRKTPAILVGGFNNPWTLAMTSDLRFRLADGDKIVDSEHPGRVWSGANDRNGVQVDDYAIVSRLLDAKTGGPLLTAAGIGIYGTQAAGEFVGSPQKIEALARSAPAGWSRKNMQIVLHVHVVDYAPGASEVVAAHFW